MKIGIIIGRIGGIDGVALEATKWIEVLKKLGHKIFIISGQYEERKMNPENETLVREMSFFSPESYWGQKNAFFKTVNDPFELLTHIEFYGKVISQKITDWINKYKLDAVISENGSALPSHLSMALGIKYAAENTGIPTITHDHDFAWERGDRYRSGHDEINEFVNDLFPLHLPNVLHAVINTNAKKDLKKMFGIDSIVVPNVMNFDISFGEITEENKCLRYDLDLDMDDILLFQVTRIVRRKGIEVAIKLIDELNDKKIKLIITGSHTDDKNDEYYHDLIDLIHKLNLHNQINFASHIINNHGFSGESLSKHYSLSDGYANARACTYFSTYEGFGNAFVEAVLAKRPIFVNNYKPVYWPDIGSKGFKTVMLEDNNLTPTAVKDIQEIIYNDKINKEIAEHNYELGKKYFSYDILSEKLQEVLSWAEDYIK